MKCPKCKRNNVYVKDTYSVDEAQTQKRVCGDCGLIITTVTAIVNIDPPRGQGAAAIAKRMKKAPRGALEINSEPRLSCFPGLGEKQGPEALEE